MFNDDEKESQWHMNEKIDQEKDGASSDQRNEEQSDNESSTDDQLTFAIGDIHGCLEQLENLMEKIYEKYYYLCSNPKFVFVGDYIDRGPNSKEVLDFLMALQGWSPDKVICLKGNHEDMMMDAKFRASHAFYNNGGDKTLKSFGVELIADVPEEYIDWMKNLPLYHDDGKRFFVHAGVLHEPLASNDANTMLWVRDQFLRNTTQWSRLIVHGHTPRSGIDILPNRINLDSGCVFGDYLTCAVFNDKQVQPIDYMQVEGLKKYYQQ